MADSTTPYAGLSPQRLTDLVNQDNTATLQLGVDFTFNAPSTYTDGSGRNTQVTMTPVPGTKWPRPEMIHYTRFPLTVLNDLPVGWVKPVLIPSVPFTLNNLLAAINTSLGLDLDLTEIVNTIYENAEAEYRLPINNAISLAWIDSAFTFKASFPGGAIPLSSVIAKRQLNGLIYLQPA